MKAQTVAKERPPKSKADRLAAALRDNLKRRKAQARAKPKAPDVDRAPQTGACKKPEKPPE